jgi:hypothetical protein
MRQHRGQVQQSKGARFVNDISTNSTYTAALEYIARGWAVIAVHGLTDVDLKKCTCGRPTCDNVGKHPVYTGWTSGPAMSNADAYATWQEDGPDWNIGIRTGEISGFFVLDIDPKSGGPAQLAALEAVHGALPYTRTVQTGSGGMHYYFLMPDFPLRNNSKKLAGGIDVRATGGQVVAPPSVSGVGPYSLLRGDPIVAAPQWLLDLLVIPAGFEVGPSIAAEDLPEYASLDPAEQERVTRYANAVLRNEAAAYAQAPRGRGNEQLFASACNILEVVQSPWNALGVHDAAAALEQARHIRETMYGRDGGGQDSEEFAKTFRSAQSKVVGQGRPMPPDPHEGLMFDHPPSGSVVTADGSADPAGECDGLMFDPRPLAPKLDPVEALLARMLDRDALAKIPAPRPLIRDMLDLDSETWIIGAPGGFKSFVALDWACHVALGLDWRGKKVHQGTVVYVAAEGAKGLPLRVRAWEGTYGHRVANVRFLPEPVQVSNAEGWAVLVAACRRLEPVLIVLDTQARITVGLEENSAKDMGILIDAVRRLKAATGACVTVVHHTGRDGGDARGSSALDGAQDTEIRVERPSKKSERALLTAAITTDKQKDGDESEAFDIQLQVVELGDDPVTGRRLTSLALAPANPFSQPPPRPVPDHIGNLVPNQQDLLEALREHANHDGGALASELIRFVKEVKGREIASNSAGTALTSLCAKGLMVRMGRRYVLPEHTY